MDRMMKLGLKPDLTMVNAGTYTRIRSLKEIVIEDKKSDRPSYIGIYRHM